MNLIITDFDGTFHDEKYLENIKFVESIKGNYDFVIATGRNFESLKKDLKINCKYYICNDGGYILDEQGNLIYNNFINTNEIKEVYNRMNKLKYEEYFFDYIYNFDMILKDNVNKLSIKIKNSKALDDMNYMLNGLKDTYGYLSNNWINILSINSKKEFAIEKILKLNNYDRIYVIGNEINDFGMLKKYSGFLISKEKNENYRTLSNFLELKKELN